MKAYVLTKGASRAQALQPENILEVLAYGPNPLQDAKEYARDHVKATDETVYIFEVELTPLLKARVSKEAVFGTFEG